MKYILFIRHVETTKNLYKEFSKDDDEDSLTKLGKKQAFQLVSFIKKMIEIKNLKTPRIYTSNSNRTHDTAYIISSKLKIEISPIHGLTSYKMGEIGGLTEFESEKRYPIFFNQLKLYRNGLLNSYAIDYPPYSENPLQFEKRVENGIKKILLNKLEDLKIVILHRSVLTATYINFARQYHNYPIDFYGFVPIDNGCVTLLELDNNEWTFRFINEKAGKRAAEVLF